MIIKNFNKGQFARIIDISFLGPFMIWYGYSNNHKLLFKTLMMSLGIGTILNNFQNLIANIISNFINQTNDIFYGLFTIIIWFILYNIFKNKDTNNN